MSDLSEYDRAIVEAAEYWVDHEGSTAPRWAFDRQRLIDAVQAKRDAQRPLCNQPLNPEGFCCQPAVQELSDDGGLFWRCAEHRIEVREL